MSRLDDAQAWWESDPQVSQTLRDRVEQHGLFQALDMTIGFQWRDLASDFPPSRAIVR